MKTISMSYKEYQDDLLGQAAKGYRLALAHVVRAIEGDADSVVDEAIDGNTNAQKILDRLGIEWKPKAETEAETKTKYTMDDIPF